MATRHQVRKSVISLLYARQMSGENAEFIEEFLESNKIRNEQKKFALSLISGVSENCDRIDALLRLNLKDFERLSAIELAILRLSTFELFYSQTDKAIIINEAIELGKSLGNENTSKLINAVLDGLKNVKIEEVDLSKSTTANLIGKENLEQNLEFKVKKTPKKEKKFEKSFSKKQNSKISKEKPTPKPKKNLEKNDLKPELKRNTMQIIKKEKPKEKDDNFKREKKFKNDAENEKSSKFKKKFPKNESKTSKKSFKKTDKNFKNDQKRGQKPNFKGKNFKNPSVKNANKDKK